ncbi:hypothetical protein SNE40_013740 [Patella caerulea]|uniref:Peptidase A2B Ty3 transposon peptidase domain-containing protein n=1 Tax=Patella caerulea TaxID=87958 RepID=A0AAN8JGI2_PATCE
MFVNSSTSVLLPTARAIVFNPSIYSARLEVRMVFDSGSQRTYITRAIQDYLCFPVVEQRTFMLKTFGSTLKTPKTLDVVSLHISTNNGDIRILAIVVPFICDKLCNQYLDRAQNGFPHLRNLNFADYNGEQIDLMIDMLIGSDEYWNFVTGEVVRGESGPTGLNTIL